MKQLLVLVVCLIGFASALSSGEAKKEAPAQDKRVLAATGIKRLPTLDDAYAVKTIGAVEVSPSEALAAFEVSGGITVQSLAPNGTQVKRLEGGSHPSWSPNGKLLAFLANAEGERQVHIWSRDADSTRPLTSFAGGVSQAGTSWAPDSRRLVLGTRLIGDYRRKLCDFEQDGVRHYDGQAPVNHLLQEGVFKLESRGGDTRKAIDCDPQLGINRIVIVNLEPVSWTEVKGAAKQYSNPSWSPDGRFIAAIADMNPPHPQPTYFGQRDNHSALSVFEVASGNERRLTVDAANVSGTPAWSADSDELLLLAERNPPSPSFTSILLHSTARDRSTFIATPGSLSARGVRWSRDGTQVVATLFDRFIDSLWKLDRDGGTAQQIQTLGWQVDSFAELDADVFLFNVQSGSFKGRLGAIGGEQRTFRLIYDANPQLGELEIGEQRRLTWSNKAGEEVDGVVILPPGYRPDRRYPTIVNPYPGSARDVLRLSASFDTGQLQAARGYVVFRLNLRSPHGIYRSFPHGEEYYEKARGAAGIPIMVDDFTSGIASLVNKGIVNPERIGMFGHSDGGWATNLIVTETSIVKAAVVISGVSNAILLSAFPLPLVTRGMDQATRGNVFDNFEEYVKLSPIFKMRELQTPMLLMVGDQDWTWVPQMIAQYGVLRLEGRDVQLIRYANEGHNLSRRESIEDALRRMHHFFDERLPEPRVQ